MVIAKLCFGKDNGAAERQDVDSKNPQIAMIVPEKRFPLTITKSPPGKTCHGRAILLMLARPITATLLGFRRVLTNRAMFSSARLDHSRDREHCCGHEAPDCSLDSRISKIVTFEELHRKNDHQRSNENSEKPLYPKSNAHRLTPGQT
jgi:hypothetical protein